MIAGNYALDLIRAGKQIFAMWNNIPNALIQEHLAMVGEKTGAWQVIIIDNEHGAMSWPQVEDLIKATMEIKAYPGYEGKVTPMVRVPESRGKRPEYTRKVLDAGGLAIMWPFPTHTTVAEVKACIDYTKYKTDDYPDGKRGFAPRRAYSLSQNYVKVINDWVFNIIQIESPEGIDALPEIVELKGLDAIFIGPEDLAQRMGYLGKSSAEPVQEAIKKTYDICKSKNVPIGITEGGIPLKDRIKQGFEFQTVSVTTSLFWSGAAQVVNTIEEGGGGEIPEL
jgi:4-hydroxy-2-oxoheptanedioate aldolase